VFKSQNGAADAARPTTSSSRRRYRAFVDDYKHRRLDALPDPDDEQTPPGESNTHRHHFRDYIVWLTPYRGAIATLILSSLVVAGLQMIEPLFLRHIVDRILLNTTIGTTERIHRLNETGALFVGLVLLSNALNAVKDYQQRLVNTRVMLALRRSMLRHMLALPLGKLGRMKTGGALSRLTGDVDTTSGLLQTAIVSPLLSVVRVIGAIVILASLNWRLALTAVAIMPGVIAVSLIFIKRIRPIYRSLRRDAEVVDGRIGETFSGIRVVRAFRLEAREIAEYLTGRNLMLRKELFAGRRELAIWTAWGLLMGSVNVIVGWYGGYLNIKGGATVGDIMAFQWYAFLLLNPIWTVVTSLSDIQRSLAAAERVFDVLAMPRDKPDRPEARAAPQAVQEIRFENVRFGHRVEQPVIHDFDLTVPAGAMVALVGNSGAGKTTVTDLLARFHDPSQGRILVNGTDIRDFQLTTYRDLVGIVQQDTFLFDGSVRDNIANGRRDANDTEIGEAARRANAHEFIMSLPSGYDTCIGEHGARLSGGEQQRLAIARALLRAPQILVFDEATSNLDAQSEQLIHAAIVELLPGRTTFVISHRLSTIQRADVILVMAEGRVIERGTHASLMQQRGAYCAMVARQRSVAADVEAEATGA
jgi:ATP-binding cassette subfamily B protein